MIDEKQQSLGGKLELNPIEARANEVLMRAKRQEIYDGSILSLISFNSHVNAIDSVILFAIKCIQRNNAAAAM